MSLSELLNIINHMRNFFERKMVEKMIDNKAEEKQEKLTEKKEKIVEYLSKISSKLKKTKDRDKKVEILVELNDYLKEYGDSIEKVCPEKLVSILNSL